MPCSFAEIRFKESMGRILLLVFIYVTISKIKVGIKIGHSVRSRIYQSKTKKLCADFFPPSRSSKIYYF